MGLDMFLYKAKKQNNKTLKNIIDLNERINNGELTEKEREEMIPFIFHIEVKEINYSYDSFFKEVMYWRKANYIHNWFVENIQNGNDDCNYYEVKNYDIEDLLNTCEKVYESLKDKETITKTEKYGNEIYSKQIYTENDSKLARELLPTVEGFFFGETDYDEYYFEVLGETIEKLKDILKNFDFDNNYLIYGSSW